MRNLVSSGVAAKARINCVEHLNSLASTEQARPLVVSPLVPSDTMLSSLSMADSSRSDWVQIPVLLMIARFSKDLKAHCCIHRSESVE